MFIRQINLKLRVRFFMFALLSALIMSAALAYAVDMQEGNWETTVEMKMEGPFPMPPMNFKDTKCLTKKDIVPNTAQKDQKCEIIDQKIIGSKATWKMRCADKDGVTEGQGEVTYRGSSYTGNMQMKMTPRDRSNQPMNINYKLTGRRIGECR
ncbi:MAG: DUF3617 family protein [Nitrospirota bacterium]